MDNKYKVVCFDMDGTLITNTNSVEFLCLLNNKGDEIQEIERKEENDIISWIEADYIKAQLFKGLEVNKVEEEFNNYMQIIEDLALVLEELKVNNFKTILVTAGPIQVAEVLNNMYGFDKIYGSIYEIKDGYFTGNIIRHLGNDGKLNSLIEFCRENKVTLDDVVAIGDSASDIKVFEKVGKAIAINYSNKLIGKADKYLETHKISNILKHIIS